MEARADDRPEFAPPPEPAAIRAVIFALLAHIVLLLALTWGITWKREADVGVAEAELWSRMPTEAAPPPAPAPAPAPPVVQAPPLPAPAPAPTPAPPPPPPPVAQPEAPKQPDIALEREKKQKEEALRRQQEEDQRRKLEAQRKQQEEAARLAKQRDDEARLAKQREDATRLAQQQKEKADAERRQREEQAKAAADKKARQLADAKRLEDQRKQNLARLQALAGAGSADSRGTAAQTRGPSASYAGRIAGRIRPNIVFTDVATGNPAAVVHLRIAPDGSIVGSHLVKSSGVKSWDDAVLRAIDKTATIPRDTDGSVVPEFDIVFRPHD